ELARAHGAVIYEGAEMRSWRSEGDGVVVETERRRLVADRLILTTGAWAVAELCRLGVAASVVRKVLLWYSGRGVERYAQGAFPCFFIADGENYFYGFPAQEPWGLKLAEHNVSHDIVSDPLQLNRELELDDEPRILDFLARFFPALKPERSKHAACMYSLTPDEHFVLDIHPECPAVVLGAGFSGHGFKFAPVVGEILAELALEGQTRQPIEFLRLSRFAHLR
ncbi:MAG: FAD-dependent oxidoreductase, partial [Candidatus Latescibacterota bacterium]|nr:FAD-dependent oxidoreductase [Candidatus Latescibacterota bacterium]